LCELANLLPITKTYIVLKMSRRSSRRRCLNSDVDDEEAEHVVATEDDDEEEEYSEKQKKVATFKQTQIGTTQIKRARSPPASQTSAPSKQPRKTAAVAANEPATPVIPKEHFFLSAEQRKKLSQEARLKKLADEDEANRIATLTHSTGKGRALLDVFV
jgi:hypothetical protein